MAVAVAAAVADEGLNDVESDAVIDDSFVPDVKGDLFIVACFVVVAVVIVVVVVGGSDDDDDEDDDDDVEDDDDDVEGDDVGSKLIHFPLT